MTAKEYEETKKNVMYDPCHFIDCSTLNCSFCPLRETAENLRKAQEDFKDVLNSFYQGE